MVLFNRNVLVVCALMLSACNGNVSYRASHKEQIDIPLVIRNYDIGTGSCAFVSCPASGEAWLMDCGSSGSRNTKIESIKGDLSNSLEQGELSIVISHADSDHLNLIPDVASDGLVRAIFLGGKRSQYTDQAFSSWLADQLDRGVPTVFVDNVEESSSGGEILDLGCGSASLSFLAADGSESKNGNSLVTGISFGQVDYLFTGDATGPVQQETIERLSQRDIDAQERQTVLIAPHHGSITHGSNSWAFAMEVSPSMVVYSSNGRRYGHPRCEAVFNYALTSSLSTVEEHTLTCGESSGMRRKQTTASMYGTADSETIEFSQLSEGSPVVVTCYDSSLTKKNEC